MKTMNFKAYDGEPITFDFSLELYKVDDEMSAMMREFGMDVKKTLELYGLALAATEHDTGMPYGVATVSFGTLISLKNVAYMDTNNAPYLAEGLLNAGVAQDTGYTRRSGFCEYPLYAFDEKFLRECGEENYELYSKAFDEYCAQMEAEEEMCEDDEPVIDDDER